MLDIVRINDETETPHSETPDFPKTPHQVPTRPLAKGLFKIPLQNWQESLGFHGGSQRARSPLQIVLWSWAAASIDALILVSLSCLFLICFILTMRLGFHVSVVKQLGLLGFAKGYLATFVVASWLYLITTRTFLGCSFGEKICQLRLGTPLDRVSDLYSLRVILRNTIILATGVVALPILSLLCSRDLAGGISGLSLFSIK